MAREKSKEKGVLGMKLYNRWYGLLIRWMNNGRIKVD